MTEEKLNIYALDSRDLVKDLDYAKIYYIPELDLLEVDYQENCLIDRKEALTVIQTSRAFKDGRNKYTMITANKDYFNMTPEARATFAEEMKTGLEVQKMALLVSNLAYRILANFFIRFDKPPVPTKVFGNRKEAIGWLVKD